MQKERPILIGGSPSSGSTLLSVMLDAHPDIHCGPEIGVLAHPSLYRGDFSTAVQALLSRLEPCQWMKNDALGNFREGLCPYALIDESNLSAYDHDLSSIKQLLRASDSIESFLSNLFEPILLRSGKTIWAEKTPSNLYAFEAFLDRFPEGRVIYVVRDPRAVVSSLHKRGMGLRRALSIWLLEVAVCERLADHPRVLRVRYEDLVQDTERILTDVAHFLNVSTAVDLMIRYDAQSSRVEQDRTLKAVTTWGANPTQPVSLQPLDAWKADLDSVTIAVMEQAELVLAPQGMDSVKGVRVADLARKLGYGWEAVDAEIGDVWERLLAERLIAVTEQKFDCQIFHERFVEAAPPMMNGLQGSLWVAVVKGVIHAFEKDSRLLGELKVLRETCCNWYSEYVRTGQTLSDVAISRDRFEREYGLAACEVGRLSAEIGELRKEREQLMMSLKTERKMSNRSERSE